MSEIGGPAYPGVFIQDDFKVNPKLTLSLGLRWEANTGWSEVNGNERSFDPNVINPVTNAPGAMQQSDGFHQQRATLCDSLRGWQYQLPGNEGRHDQRALLACRDHAGGL
jgi:hypothetical protein